MCHPTLRKATACLPILISALVAYPAYSAALPSAIATAGHLTIGINCSYPPAGYVGLDGQPAGYEITLAKRIAKAAFSGAGGLQTQCVNDSNRIAFLQSGKVDMVLAALAWTPARAEQIDFSDPIWVSNLQLVVKKDSPIKSYKDLAGKTVVTTTGNIYEAWLAKCTKADIVTAQSPADSANLLTQGRADAMAYIDVYSFNFVKHHPEYRLAGNLASPAIQGIGVRKGNAELTAWLNGVIADMRANDVFYDVFKDEVADSAFAAKYRPVVPSPNHKLAYVNPAIAACTE
ncbi:transporter substrate-binding domain-containing protein [Burkholderia sp. L27(2015)]|uniref:transporter substrate-binding domain-containing protein n=1 Tax=Burkholderia sp. L27(2015) TaxID=1641858 RepID=UPI00131DEF3D|nr:transporter substrate-binding domain-containing protein [Burkholderia sp. L27(2015)]